MTPKNRGRPYLSRLTEALDDSTARAGVVTDPEPSLPVPLRKVRWETSSSTTTRTQFIIQSDRPSAYYIGYGGQIIDADIIRPIGQTGRDLIDDWMPMVGLGRIIAPDSVEVAGAMDAMEGLRLFEASVAAPHFRCSRVPSRTKNLSVISTAPSPQIYSLTPTAISFAWKAAWSGTMTRPRSKWVILNGRLEVSDFWNPQAGLDGSGSGEWHGLVGEHNDIALGIFSDDAPISPINDSRHSLNHGSCNVWLWSLCHSRGR